jgi:hypothetical protein
MNGTQVGVFKESHKVCFGSLLKGQDSSRLESEIRLEVLCHFTDKTLERGLADQEIGRLLILSDLTKSNGTWAVSVRLLDASRGWGRLSSSLVVAISTNRGRRRNREA